MIKATPSYCYADYIRYMKQHSVCRSQIARLQSSFLSIKHLKFPKILLCPKCLLILPVNSFIKKFKKINKKSSVMTFTVSENYWKPQFPSQMWIQSRKAQLLWEDSWERAWLNCVTKADGPWLYFIQKALCHSQSQHFNQQALTHW